MAESLKKKTVKGLGWSALDNAARYGMQFVIGIVLARLLSPDDYGLLGLVGIFTMVCTALVNGGFTTALIRKKDATDDDYNTVFICNLGMSLLLYAVVFLCAPLIADFFSREELIPLVRVSSLGLIIGALGMVQQTRLTKRIDFKTQTKITLVASAVSGVVGIGMALAGFGVWALVGQQLTSHALRTIQLYIYNRWLPRLQFSMGSFRDLFGFGWKMMVSALLDTVWKELYQVVVGKFYNPATLGQYTRGQHYAKLFSSNLTTVVQRVTYPVLSSIQDDKERMVSAYRRIIRTSMFITAVALFFLGAVSEPLIYCMIGPKWHEASTYLPLICVASTLYPLHAINLNMLQVQGRSDLFLGLEVIKKVIALAPLFIGAFVGIMPMLWTNIVVGIIAYFLNSYYSGRLLGYSSWMQLRDIAPSYSLAMAVALSVYFLKWLPLSYWVVLPLQIVVGAVVFFTLCKMFKMNEYKEIMDILKKAPRPPKGGASKCAATPPSGGRGAYKVCVRCATFNHAAYITQTMDGFCMQQTDFPFICVITDDASTDGAQQVIRQYLNEQFEPFAPLSKGQGEVFRHKTNSNCYFVVYLLEENHYSQGKSPLVYANPWMEQSDYAALCEGDDYWTDVKKLQRQADALDANRHAVMVYTNFRCVGANGEPVSRPLIERFPQRSHSGDNLPTLFRYGNYVLTLTTMYRREVWDSEAFKCCPVNIDFNLILSAALMGDFIWLPEQTANYRSLQSGMVMSNLQKGMQMITDIYRYYAGLLMNGQCKPLSLSKRIKITIFILKWALKRKDHQLKKNTLSACPLSCFLLPIAFIKLKIKNFKLRIDKWKQPS